MSLGSPWKVIERRPYSRGVTQLMYVGDDEAVDKATAPNRNAVRISEIGIAVAIFGLATGKRKVRNVGAILAVAGFLAI